MDRILASSDDVMRIQGSRVNARWVRDFTAYDPKPVLARVAVPVQEGPILDGITGFHAADHIGQKRVSSASRCVPPGAGRTTALVLGQVFGGPGMVPPGGGGRQGWVFGPRHHTSVKMSKRPRSVVVLV
jgi:hypothetical protein